MVDQDKAQAGSSDERFSRRELLRQARMRGIKVPRGASDEEIDRLIGDRFRADYEAIWEAVVSTDAELLHDAAAVIRQRTEDGAR